MESSRDTPNVSCVSVSFHHVDIQLVSTKYFAAVIIRKRELLQITRFFSTITGEKINVFHSVENVFGSVSSIKSLLKANLFRQTHTSKYFSQTPHLIELFLHAWLWNELLLLFNPFVPNAPFLCLLKTL